LHLLAGKAADLAGFGAISPAVLDDIKTAAAGGFEYCRTITSGGAVVHHQASSRRYKPTTAQRRLMPCTAPAANRAVPDPRRSATSTTPPNTD
jgi:hypothetical protein